MRHGGVCGVAVSHRTVSNNGGLPVTDRNLVDLSVTATTALTTPKATRPPPGRGGTARVPMH